MFNFNEQLKEEIERQKVLIDMQWEHIKELEKDVEFLEKRYEEVYNAMCQKIVD